MHPYNPKVVLQKIRLLLNILLPIHALLQLLKLPRELWKDVDVIIPVPLHWKKQRKRGYNQSAVFGEGIAEAMGINCPKNVLRRVTHDKSLTGMKRLQRVETIGSSFVLSNSRPVQNKNVKRKVTVWSAIASSKGAKGFPIEVRKK